MLAGIAALASSCATIDFLTDDCSAESIIVTWPVAVTRGEASITTVLTGTVSPGNINQSQFNQLKGLLVTGGPELATSVVWTVPAFVGSGGFIAMAHKAPLTNGYTEAVNLSFDGGGWGLLSLGQNHPAGIALRADNFVATSATGSIRVVSGTPVILRVDVTAKSAINETIRVVGDASFRYEERASGCS